MCILYWLYVEVMEMYKILIYLFVFGLVLQVQSQWIQNLGMPPAYQNETYLDVFFLKDKPNIGWACGFKGITLRTIDAGKTWKVAHLPFNLQLESIHFVNEKVGFTSGPLSSGIGLQDMILKSIDGGATWKNITPDIKKFNTEFDGLEIWGNYFVDENNGFVIGGGCGTPQRFFKTTNGGNTWTMVEYSEPSSKMSDLIVYPDGNGIAVGSGWLWKSTDFGKNWDLFNRTGGSAGAFNNDWQEELSVYNQSIALPYSKDCNGSTEVAYGGVRLSTDGGTNWIQYSTSKPMYGTFMVDEKAAWGVGFDRTAVYTSDAGKTWVNYTCGVPSGINFDDIWVINDTTIWIAGDGLWQYKPINKLKPQIAANDSIVVCDGEIVELSTTEKYLNYQWSTGETTPTIKVSKAGKYFVKVFNEYICDSATTKAVNVLTFKKQDIQILSNIKNNKPCAGDIVFLYINDVIKSVKWNTGEITKSISVTKDGVYQAEIIDSNGCVVIKEFPIEFDPNPKPVITKISKMNLCIGDSVTLIAPDGYSNYNWFKDYDSNSFSNEKLVLITNSGSYRLLTTTQNGCSNYSDSIYVDIKIDSNQLQYSFSNNDSVFVIDSTNYPAIQCRDLEIKNISWKTAVIDNPYFFKNLSFSAPASQFPILIEPNQSKTFKVCYSPRRIGEERDTIGIKDNCSEHIIPILSWGIAVGSDGNTRCDVDIEIVPKGLSTTFSISNPYPNPASNQVEIKYNYKSNEESGLNYNISLIDIFGKQLSNAVLNKLISENKNNIYREEGKIIFDTSKLSGGMYFISININGFSKLLKIVKN